MARNSRTEHEARDPSSSAEEEEEDASSEENGQEDSGSESEEEDHRKGRPPISESRKLVVSKKPEASEIRSEPQSSSSSDDESGSDSDLPPRTIKPLASKPMEEPPIVSRASRSKPTPPKRPADLNERDSKKAKKTTATTTSEDSSKKQLFQRLWSEEDEVEILKGMIGYIKKGSDPVADISGFHDFIRKSLHVDVSNQQLSDKMRRLKKKYTNNANRGKGGVDPTFSKPHELKCYELSKMIWGVEASNGDMGLAMSPKKKKKTAVGSAPKKMEELGLVSPAKASEGVKSEAERSAGGPLLSGFSADSRVEAEILNYGLELIGSVKKAEMEEKWRKLKMEEYELYLKRLDLLQEQTKLVLDSMKSRACVGFGKGE